MKEIWKDIKSYEGCYQVSNLGRVRSLDRVGFDNKRYKGKILKPAIGHVYLGVTLSLNGKAKTRTIHQLVAESFLNHTPDGYKIVVDHIDNDRQNNKLENLQLISQRQNVSKGKVGESNYTGVYTQSGGKKFVARCWHDNKSIYLGQFNTRQEASKVYNNYLNSIT
jgi:hypothetical protein